MSRRLLHQFHHLHGVLLCLGSHAPEGVGGQAVVEGVMMRSPGRLAVAVRAPGGGITVDNRPFVPFARRHRLLGWPIVRGAASLIEALAIGVQALNFSMAVAEGQGEGSPEFSRRAGWRERVTLGATLLASFAMAMALFQYLPYWIAGRAAGSQAGNPFVYNLAAGAVRLALLLAYLWAITWFPDVRRVFQYHGAEHKSIFAHEKGLGLTVDHAGAQSRFHPRCGTSFILIVALVCVFLFSLFDLAVLRAFPHAYPNATRRFLVHLPLVPLVAGCAFELLKLSARSAQAWWVRPLVAPGLWLQKITTRDPDSAQLEVALASIQAALAK